MNNEHFADVSIEQVGGMWRVTAIAHDLRVAKDYDMSLFWTPGASFPEWFRQPNPNAERVATVDDFLDAEGFSDLDGFDDDDTFSVVIEAPEERPFPSPGY